MKHLIKKASDVTKINLLVYGNPGTGKTHLVGSAADSGLRTLILDSDKGTMTIRNTSADVIQLTSFSQLVEAVRWLTEEGHKEYDLVALDNLTESQKQHVDELKIQHGKKFGLHSWGRVMEGSRFVIKALRDLPCHSIMITHAKEVLDELNGRNMVKVRPALHGSSLPHEVGGFFDLVGYSHTYSKTGENIEYRLGFAAANDRHICKDRSGKLSMVEVNDWGVISDKVLGTANTDPKSTK